MNINLYDVYNQKLRKFARNDSVRMRGAFIEAVNNVFGELNSDVFEQDLMTPIESFDDIMDSRLAGFVKITFDEPSDTAISEREMYSFEWEMERIHTSNGFTETITDDASNVVFSIANGVFSVVGDSVNASAVLPEYDKLKIVWTSDIEGNRLTVNDGAVELIYTVGDSETIQPIGTIAAVPDQHVIDGVSGYEITRLRFLTSNTLVYDFNLNEGVGNDLTSLVSDPTTDPASKVVNSPYTATVDTPAWEFRYVEPSTNLDQAYISPFQSGVDFHLQESGEWAMEPEGDRERRWYGRGIRQARSTFRIKTPYQNPLGI